MRVDRQIAIWAGWIAGPAFGVAMMAAPEYFHPRPSATAALFWGGIIIFVVTIFIVLALSAREQEKRHKPMWPIIVTACGFLIVGIGAAGYFWPRSEEAKDAQTPDRDPVHGIGASPHVPNRTARFGDLAVLSNGDLRRLTPQFAAEMRTFERNLRLWDTRHAFYPSGISEEEKHRLWEAETQKMRDTHRAQAEAFRNQFFLDTMALRGELVTRNQRAGILIPDYSRFPVFYGQLAGPNPISDAADYLETLARRLPD